MRKQWSYCSLALSHRYITSTKVNDVICGQHITSMDHSTLTRPPKLPSLVVHNSDQKFSIFSHTESHYLSYWLLLPYSITRPQWHNYRAYYLTHWGRVTHICVSNLTNIDSDNGLSPGRRKAIIWTNAGLLLIGPLGTNFNEILIKILTFSFKKMRLKF